MLKEREMRLIIKISDTTIKDYSRIFNLNLDRIIGGLKLTYEEYRDIILDEIAKSKISENTIIKREPSGKISVEDSTAMQEIDRLFQFLDNYYSFKNSKNFLIELYRTSMLVNENKLADIENVDFDVCGDFFVDFSVGKEYAPITLKFLKADYKIYIKALNKEYEAYNVTLLTNKDNIITNMWGGILIPEMYPRILIAKDDNTKCKDCNICNMKEYEIREMGSSLKTEFCLVGKKLAENCKLLQFKPDDFSPIRLDIHAMIAVIAHICRVFPNRNTVDRKNSRIRKTYEKASIHVVRNNTKEDNIVSLGLYAKQETYEKKEWKGGHHSSPVEHERRGHIRRYRDNDGNITREVKVRSTIINKGNSKVVYRV